MACLASRSILLTRLSSLKKHATQPLPQPVANTLPGAWAISLATPFLLPVLPKSCPSRLTSCLDFLSFTIFVVWLRSVHGQVPTPESSIPALCFLHAEETL